MSETATEVQMARIRRLQQLAEVDPIVWRHAFAWLAGVATVNAELGEHLDKAINYVERTFPL